VKKDLRGALNDAKKALEIEPGSLAGRDLLKQIESAIAGGALEPDSAPPLRVMGGLKPPKLIKQVDPVYPEVARQALVQGMVIIQATTDLAGKVIDARILKSIPLLDDAALTAVKQWIYEPCIIDGKKRGVIFTVTLNFNIK
jgi:protein TonB